jgi:formate--tetrahydrofolate ligase
MTRQIDWFFDFAQKIGFKDEEWYMGHETVAKIRRIPQWGSGEKKGKLVLVTAMSPTPFGEGKTTTVIALNDALNSLGKNSIATLRQPSLGPVFGKKGGATGGGKASVVPRDKIDLGLTGDFFAVESANNMIAALVDNHKFHNLSPVLCDDVVGSFPRCLDMNDRSLRKIQSWGGSSSFVITAASELMAILSLSKDFQDLKRKLGNIVIGKCGRGKFVTAKELNFHQAPAVLLRDAMYPNLVKSAEANPVLMHAGPFANIAQGTCSINATALGMEMADYVITEAGFGAELGAEKFFNIKCRKGEFDVAATVIVATSRALLHHGGLENLLFHVENCKKFGPEVVVAINKFEGDDDEQLQEIIRELRVHHIKAAICDGYTQGPDGAKDLAQLVVEVARPTEVEMTYSIHDELVNKVEAVAKNIYHAKDVEWAPEAMDKIEQLESCGYGESPICMAKTPLSISDDSSLKGVPRDHTLHIKDIHLQAGAGFVVVKTGSVQLLPGLPIRPRALDIELTDEGKIIW